MPNIEFDRVLEGVKLGSVVVTMNVTEGVGNYSFYFLTNPDSLFSLKSNGSANSIDLILSGLVDIGTYNIAVAAKNEAGDIVKFFINAEVTEVARRWTPFQRPFSKTSPANLPILDGTNYHPLNWPVATGFNYSTGIKFYIDIPDPLEKNTVTWTGPASWGNPTQVISRQMTKGFAGVTQITGISDGGDNEAISVVNNISLNIYNFNVSGNTATSGAFAYDDMLDGTGFGDLTGLVKKTPGVGAGVVATGSNNVLGCLIKEEFTATGEFNHWIAFSMLASLCNNQTPNYYAPAISGDGFSGDGLFCEGQLMAIPKTTPMPNGLSVYGQAIFRAMRDYGAWCHDTSGAITPYLARWYKNTGAAPWCEPSSWENSDVGLIIADINILFPLLYKTGYLLDGYLYTSGVASTWSPQIQLLRYLGNLLTVTRDSDGHAGDVGSVGPPSGNLNVGSITSFCSGTIGRVTNYYDQIGNGRNVVSLGSNAPIIYQSGALVTMNGNPAMKFDGSTNFMKINSSSGVGGYLNIGFQLDDLSSVHTLFGSDVSGGLRIDVDTNGSVRVGTNTGTIYGQTAVNITAGTPWVVEVNYAGATTSVSFNGVKVASFPTGTPASGNILIGSATAAGANLFKGMIGSFSLHGGPSANAQYTIGKYLSAFWGATAHNFTLDQDSFTGTDGTSLPSHSMDIGGPWTNQIGTFSIQGNKAQATANVSNQAIATFNAVAEGHYQCKVTNVGGFGAGATDFPGLVFRYSDSNNYYLLQVEGSNNRLAFYRVQGGGRANLGFYIASFPNGSTHTLDVFMVGTTITVQIDGVQVFQIVNTFNVAASLAGIRSEKAGSPANASFDDMKFISL